MASKISVGIVDDHKIVRNGLKQLLEMNEDFEVTIEYENGLRFVKEVEELEEKPNVFLLDYSMPMMNGLQVLKELKNQNSSIKCIILTQHDDQGIKIDAYEVGARGFLNKTCDLDELVSTINRVHEHGYDNFEEILKLLRNKTTVESLGSRAREQFTNRELQLIELICNDNEYTYQQIADHMNLSIKSVDACRSQLFQKLDVRSKVGLVLYSFHYKLTHPFLHD
ncbi:hypothetical protein BST97_08400 [Nonlabens spongiae]|uniref:DNA-binding response regulator n=1 Tax=Nonlabens spongiae TaxID=331648 RepID=A0A1W6MK77_9FLAO|nr:response regulator transcription factor [Nonlabens spongiae]ARN78018.1 hypothetical protein BST97_08400 [Nonlabens spongiae]